MRYTSVSGRKDWNTSFNFWKLFLFSFCSFLLLAACAGIPGFSDNLNSNGTGNSSNNTTINCNGVNNNCSVNNSTQENSSQPESGNLNSSSNQPMVPIMDGEFPQNIAGPAEVEWYNPSTSQCGIFKLNQGEGFNWPYNGHYWIFASNTALNADYSSHLAAYRQKYSEQQCPETRPSGY